MVAVHTWIIAVGFVLAAGPLVLHLLMQPKPKRVPFPAMRFLREVQHKARRSFQMRHWLLLLLRILLPLMFAFALARPAAASAVFGSYVLLGVTAISAILFGFLTFFWWQKSKDRPAAAAPVKKYGESTITERAQATLSNISNSRWPLYLLLAVFVAHFGAVIWLAATVFNGPKATLAISGQDPVSAVLLVDTSPRMQYRHDNRTRLQHTKDIAKWIVDQLPAESQIAVLDSRDITPGMSLDLAAARSQIDNLEITFLPVNLKKRITESVQLLEESQWEGRELYVLSDMTVPSWDQKSGGENILNQEGLTHSISTYLVDTGTRRFDNWNIQKWQVGSSTITPGGMCSVKATISRTSGTSPSYETDSADSTVKDSEAATESLPIDTQTETRTIRLFVEKHEEGTPTFQNGKTVVPSQHFKAVTQVSLAPGQAQEISLQVPNLPEGEHQCWVEIEGGDAMPFDNRRYFTIRVEPARKILLVTGPGVSDTNFREAIDPFELRKAGQSVFDCEVISQANLSKQALQSYRSIYLLDPSPIEAQQWQLLSTYVRRGGSCGIFLGNNAASSNLAKPTIDPSFNSPEAQKLLPAKIEDNPWRDPSGQLFLLPKAWDHKMFAELKPYQDQLTWHRLPVFLHWGIDPEALAKTDQNAESEEGKKEESGGKKNKKDTAEKSENVLKTNRILADFSNNQPAIIQTQYGQGTLLTITTPITDPIDPEGRRSWNTFSASEKYAFTYWLWINQTAEFLATSNAGKINGTVGESFILKNESGDAPRKYTLFRPQDANPVEIQSQKGILNSTFSNLPGSYRLKGINGQRQSFVKGYAVNCQSSLSNLMKIDPEKLKIALGKDNFTIVESKEKIIRKQGKGKLGLEFYPSIIRLLAVFFLVEMIFSNWFYRRDISGPAAGTTQDGGSQ